MRRSSRISDQAEIARAKPEPPAPPVAAPKPAKRKQKKPKAAQPARQKQAPAPVPAANSTLDDLVSVVDRLDDNLRLLFHLEKFVSLVYYNPHEAKQDNTAIFREWRTKHDPWEPALDAAANRVERRNITRIMDDCTHEIKEMHAQPRAVKKPKRDTTKQEVKQEAEQEAEQELEQEYEAEYYEAPAPPTLNGSQQSISWTHPSHIVRGPFGGSLESLLATYKLLEEDQALDLAKWEEVVAARASTLAQIRAAAESGLLHQVEYQTGLAEIPKFVDPPHDPTHADILLAAAAERGKLFSRRRKLRLNDAKKAAQNVENYHKRLAGAEERLRKEQERDIKNLHRRIADMVNQKWKLAKKVVEQRRQKVLDEENNQKRKEYLNQVLEQSEQLLQNQYTAETLEDEMEALSSEPESDSQDDAGDERSDNEDAHLTTEQLREKYKDAIEAAQKQHQPSGDYLEGEPDEGESEDGESENEIEEDNEIENDNENEEDFAAAAAADIPPEELERIKEAYAQEQSESDVSLSDSGESSESESDGASDNGASGDTLSMLLGGAVDEESDEELVMSDDAKSDVDMADERDHAESAPEEGDSDQSSPAQSPTPETPAATEDALVPVSPPHIETVEREHKIETPFLLRGALREYQRDGLDWLAGLYNSQTNGILADEMGLGKTIQTISLLAHLACEKHIWGPHLIVVPTSVMLNWEMEFKRFAPGFKVLTYYGNPQQRKDKRRGWNKEDTWHVCITSYQLVLQDQAAFKRKRWKYMILDEAHNIKNFRSQRWQALLNFNSERRLLLTGTPLQNNLIELWSLLYFLMPSSKGTQMMPEGFANLEDFQEWFSRPVDQMVEEGGEADSETRNTVSKLHQVLRPYILRRLKVDVEKQMPGKYEHVIYCKLSKRQRYLYDDFMSRAATRDTLASGNFMGILNCLMQLRKVCNHPDLFEVRPIKTSWAIPRSVVGWYGQREAKLFDVGQNWGHQVNFNVLNLALPDYESENRTHSLMARDQYVCERRLAELAQIEVLAAPGVGEMTSLEKWAAYAVEKRRLERDFRKNHAQYLCYFKSHRVPLYGVDLRKAVAMPPRLPPLNKPKRGFNWNVDLSKLILGIPDREEQLKEVISRYAFVTPEVVCLDYPQLMAGKITADDLRIVRDRPEFHESQVKLSIQFPDKRLLQYDCGKLQHLDMLLRDLIPKGHRVLIFTQMTRVLDILEQFLNIHGHRYLRLDGATRVEERQVLTERFNKDPSIPVFILSTRSGGLGINLTGADTVIFYDSDWNPAMDRQCQDRCHRIGQTRDVHIYRFVSEYTIESNILKKATQKTILDNVVIQEGGFTTDYFKKLSVKEIITGNEESSETVALPSGADHDLEAALQGAEEADDVAAANMAMSEARLDVEEFTEVNKQEAEKSATPAAEATLEQQEQAQEETEEPEEEQVPEGLGHIDDYMIKFIEDGMYDSD